MGLEPAPTVVDWLLEGDPAVRWQTMRDLQGRSEAEWSRERQLIPEVGWGKAFLEALLPDDTWPEGRWTGAVWTLNTLIDLGFPPDHERVRSVAARFLDARLNRRRDADVSWLLKEIDLCHVGFWLRIGAYFQYGRASLTPLAETLIGAQFPDGGWNCRARMKPKTSHSSFHTTFNVLEALREAASSGIVDPNEFQVRERQALNFMLDHQMYRSDRTGEVVDERFKNLTYPSHWHYTVLRGLDYLHRCPEIADTRLADPISLLEGRQKRSGRWPVEKRIPGVTLFEMEQLGGESRWNTLRASRVLAARTQLAQKAVAITPLNTRRASAIV